MYKEYCYLVCDVTNDLPVACFDRFLDVVSFLDCSRATVARMIKNGSHYCGFYIEKVSLIG